MLVQFSGMKMALFVCVSRNERIQLWQSGIALHIGSISGFQWKKMLKMPQMEVLMYGMSPLKLHSKIPEASFVGPFVKHIWDEWRVATWRYSWSDYQPNSILHVYVYQHAICSPFCKFMLRWLKTEVWRNENCAARESQLLHSKREEDNRWSLPCPALN